jgi:hypothetical protein
MTPRTAARSVVNMPTTTHKLTAAALATAAAATAALTLSGAHVVPAASAIDPPRTMTFIEPFSSDRSPHGRYIDIGKKGMSPGDMIFHTKQTAVEEGTGRRVGSDGVETILTADGGTVAVSDTVRLPGGHVLVAGTLRHTDRTAALAVIGGTGAYANAHGEVTITEDTKHKRNITNLTLLP